MLLDILRLSTRLVNVRIAPTAPMRACAVERLEDRAEVLCRASCEARFRVERTGASVV
jgi:hypothetical protein